VGSMGDMAVDASLPERLSGRKPARCAKTLLMQMQPKLIISAK